MELTTVDHAAGDAEPRNAARPVLEVEDLVVSYGGAAAAVRGVSFAVGAGETVGIVGESGSGKSTTALAAVGLAPLEAAVTGGAARFEGQDLVRARPRDRRRLLGDRIGVVYQDPLTALNPVMRIGPQIGEVFEAHDRRRPPRERLRDVLDGVGIADADRRLRAYPHEFSGGMRQRTIIGMALARSPSLVIADEPTTAVDVTVQAQILDLLDRLTADHGTATLLVSHDLGVIARMCQRVLVMYAGRVVESGPVEQVFADPTHPYTRALLAATPDVGRPRRGTLPFIAGRPPQPHEMTARCQFAPRCEFAEDLCHDGEPELLELLPGQRSACAVVQRDGTDVLPPAVDEVPAEHRTAPTSPIILRASGLRREYESSELLARRRRRTVAVDGVDLELHRGEMLAVVGESGCGKSTLGRMLVGLEPLDAGDVEVDELRLADLRHRQLRDYRQRVQMIFQDPRSSLNPAMTVGWSLREPLRRRGFSRAAAEQEVTALLVQVGLPPTCVGRRPGEFSGGQSQRIAIARALATGADVLVADEAVSSLDVSVKGQVLSVLDQLRADRGTSIVFITHDLSVVREACDRVAVMYLGRVVEVGPTDDVFASPAHPYTAALLSAVPVPDPVRERERRRVVLTGGPPSPASPPAGCRFHPRCQVGPQVDPSRTVCHTTSPDAVPLGPGRQAACHFAEEVDEPW